MIYRYLDKKGLTQFRGLGITAEGSFRAKGGGWRGWGEWMAEAQRWSSGEMPCTPHQPAFAVQQGWSKSRDNDQIQAGASDCQASPGHWGRLSAARGESDSCSGSLDQWGAGPEDCLQLRGAGKWTSAVILCRAVPLLPDKHSPGKVCEWRMVLSMHICTQVNWKGWALFE